MTRVTDGDGHNMWAVLLGKDRGALEQPLTEDNSWLEFQVKWKGWSSKDCPDGTTWVPQGNLCCDKLLARFVQDIRRRRIVPLPGQRGCHCLLPYVELQSLHRPCHHDKPSAFACYPICDCRVHCNLFMSTGCVDSVQASAGVLLLPAVLSGTAKSALNLSC